MLNKKMQNTIFEIKAANLAEVRPSSLPIMLSGSEIKSRREKWITFCCQDCN